MLKFIYCGCGCIYGAGLRKFIKQISEHVDVVVHTKYTNVILLAQIQYLTEFEL